MKRKFLILLLTALMLAPAALPAAFADVQPIVLSDTTSAAGFGEMAVGLYPEGPSQGLSSIYMESNHDVRFTYSGEPVDITALDESKAALTFWLYVSQKIFLTSTGQFELGSSGNVDDANEFTWVQSPAFLEGLTDNSWHKIALRIVPAGSTGSNQTGTVDRTAINFFRMYNIASDAYDGGHSKIKMLFSNLMFEELDPSEFADGSLLKIMSKSEYEGEALSIENVIIILDNGVHIGENGTPPPVHSPDVVDATLPEYKLYGQASSEGCFGAGISSAAAILAVVLGIAAIGYARRKKVINIK